MSALDSGGASVERSFLIEVAASSNTPPVAITLSSSNVAENASAGTFVGKFIAQDARPGDVYRFALVTGNGSLGNSRFDINEKGELLVSGIADFDYEAASAHSIRVRCTNSMGLAIEQPFTIFVDRANLPPAGLLLQRDLLRSGAPAGTRVGRLVAADPNSGSTFTYSLATGSGSADNPCLLLSTMNS